VTTERFQEIERIFNAACALHPTERASYLDRTCGDDADLHASVKAMLAQDAQSSLAIDPDDPKSRAAKMFQAVADAAWDATPHSDSAMPDRIGNYRIIRCLGEGGMGIVFEAEQDRPRRRVALKVIRNTMARRQVLRRFELEAQVLGSLQHVGIAQIFEADSAPVGETVRPYLAMEFVDGSPITEYADKRRLGVHAILELFCKLCDAVQYAHQKGVIHRDLKPPNILVTESGQPKVLDFGVARVTDADMQVTTQQTDVGQLIGTLQYMSPEQANADASQLDTRSDVYALGVLLYELLAGQPPYDLSGRSITDAVYIIREQNPSSLSTINRNYRGDIETIVLKAIDKNRERRYASAAEFSADIRRHLHCQPIDARPPSTLYQLTRFAQRHRGMAAAVVITFVALLVGATTATYGLFQAQRERNEANRQAAIAEAVNDFLTNDLLAAVRPDAQGIDASMRSVLAVAAERIDDRFEDQPIVEASIRFTLGTTYLELGEYALAEPLFRTALELREKHLGPLHAATMTSLNDFGVMLKQWGRYEQATEHLRTALQRRIEKFGPEHENVLESMNDLAATYDMQGREEEAIDLYEKALPLCQRLLGPDHVGTMTITGNLAVAYHSVGRHAEANPMQTKLLETKRRVRGEDHPSTLFTMNNVGINLQRLDRWEESEAMLRQAVNGRRRVLGEDHPYTLWTTHFLIKSVAKLGRLDEAEEMVDAIIQQANTSVPADHWYHGTFRQLRGAVLKELGRLEEAEEAFVLGARMIEESLGKEHVNTLSARQRVATFYESLERMKDAESWRP